MFGGVIQPIQPSGTILKLYKRYRTATGVLSLGQAPPQSLIEENKVNAHVVAIALVSARCSSILHNPLLDRLLYRLHDSTTVVSSITSSIASLLSTSSISSSMATLIESADE